LFAYTIKTQRTANIISFYIELDIVMAALPNIGGALCSTPQSLADAYY